MDISLTHTTILSPLPAGDAPFPSHAAISLLPFSIAFDGPARVSTYFHPVPITSTSITAPLRQEAAFRGRLLVSERVPLPKGYTGLVIQTSRPVAAAPTTTEEGQEQERKAKRARQDATRDRERAAAVARGLRRSPRKAVKREVKRFKLDSDDEDDEEDGAGEGSEATLVNAEAEGEPTVVESDAMPGPPPALARTRTPSPAPFSTAEDSQATLLASPIAEMEPEIKLERDALHLLPSATFTSLDIYHADHAGELQEDVYRRTMAEWIGLSAKIHAY